MRGRAQAALIAVIGNLLPLITPATVGLVTLRRGVADGSLILLWALLPLLATYLFSETSSALALISIIALAVLPPAAWVLKYSGSWQLTLLTTLVVSVLLAFCLMQLFASQMVDFQSSLTTMMKGIDSAKETMAQPPVTVNEGFLAYVLALNAMVSLILARWWQSELYNPGGFGREFRSLRLATPIAGLLVGGMVLCLLMPQNYISWVALLGLPLLFSGIGLVHYAVLELALGGYWLVFFYLALALIGPMMSALVVMLGFVDSLMNLRPRLTAMKRGR